MGLAEFSESAEAKAERLITEALRVGGIRQAQLASRLSPKEEAEYDALIELSDMLATLQLKARQQLTSARSS